MFKDTNQSKIMIYILGSILISIIISIVYLFIQVSTGSYWAKPIIYLYPEIETNISVKLENKDCITVSYPEYDDGWIVTAKPDGTLIDSETGRELY